MTEKIKFAIKYDHNRGQYFVSQYPVAKIYLNRIRKFSFRRFFYSYYTLAVAVDPETYFNTYNSARKAITEYGKQERLKRKIQNTIENIVTVEI